MHVNVDGFWAENDGMWKTITEDGVEYRAPLSPNELKQK